jgi:hypothetical protein
MPIYHKTVKAFQWNGEPDLSESPGWFLKFLSSGLIRVIDAPSGGYPTDEKYLQIRNPKGITICCRSGDYVVFDGKETFSRCASAIFDTEYEYLSEDDPPEHKAKSAPSK